MTAPNWTSHTNVGRRQPDQPGVCTIVYPGN